MGLLINIILAVIALGILLTLYQGGHYDFLGLVLGVALLITAIRNKKWRHLFVGVAIIFLAWNLQTTKGYDIPLAITGLILILFAYISKDRQQDTGPVNFTLKVLFAIGIIFILQHFKLIEYLYVIVGLIGAFLLLRMFTEEGGSWNPLSR